MTTTDAVRWRALTAHGDAWQVHGRLRGGAGELPGVRLMASGLAHAQWNNADVHDPSLVDVDALRAWYAGRGVPWGVRVPTGSPWAHGTFLFRKPLAVLDRARFTEPAPSTGLELRAAGPADLDEVVAVDHAAFGGERDATRAWCAPLLSAPQADVVLAHRDGAPVGTGYVLRSDGWAGPAAYLVGLTGPVDDLAGWLLARAFAAGAEFAHTHQPVAGFTWVDGLDVYVDV